jgi:hypothetical protein
VKTQVAEHLKEQRFVAAEALNVAADLVGRPLARPAQRGLAMALDLGVVALLSGVSGLWLIGGLAAVLLQLRSARGASAAGMTSKRRWLGWGLAAVLGLLVVNEAKDQWVQHFDPAAAAAAAADNAEDAEEDKAPARRQAEVAHPDVPATPISPASAAATAVANLDAAKQRIANLEAELAEAKKPQPFRFRDQMTRLFSSIGVQFGWGIVYFSLLPAWWGGQTVGKKILGLRVVEITGQPMTVMRCLKRYGGYAAGMATGGLGFGQLLWDPNRQGIQDKAAHTVVLDLRSASATQLAPAKPPPVPVETLAPQPPPTA